MARWQVPVVLGAVALGLVLGLALDVGPGAEALVVPALVGLLALTFTGIRPAGLATDVRPHRAVVAADVVLNFLWAPAAAGLLGWLLLGGQADLRVGLVMLLVTPCTDWYLVFTASARGNLPLAAALLPLNLVLQLALLPLFVSVLAGADAEVPLGDLVTSTLLVLGLPLALAVALRAGAARMGATAGLDVAVRRLEPAGLALLAVAITAMFATHAQQAVDDPGALARLALPLGVFFLTTFLLVAATARLLGLAVRERATLTLVAMARNSPIALAIAAAAFPDRPLIALALVVGPLIELPVLALTARALAPRAAAG